MESMDARKQAAASQETQPEPIELDASDIIDESEAELPPIPLDGEGRSYDEMAGNVADQAKFWEDNLDLQQLIDRPGEMTVYKRRGGQEQNRVVFDQKQNTEHIIHDLGAPALQFNDMPAKAKREVEKAHDAGGDWRATMEANRSKTLSEYKIHLQPKKEYIPAVVDKLLQEIDKRPFLRELIPALKARMGSSEKAVQRPDGTTETEQQADIVLYLKMGDPAKATGPAESRQNMEMALAAVAEIVQEFEQVGSGKKPRENHKISDLIYVAQGGGDLKSALKDFGAIEDYFDREADGSFSFAKGEKPPTAEDIARGREAFQAREAELQRAVEQARLDEAKSNLEQAYAAPAPQQPEAIAPIDISQEVQDTLPPPPPPAKKKGLLARLFGR